MLQLKKKEFTLWKIEDRERSEGAQMAGSETGVSASDDEDAMVAVRAWYVEIDERS